MKIEIGEENITLKTFFRGSTISQKKNIKNWPTTKKIRSYSELKLELNSFHIFKHIVLQSLLEAKNKLLKGIKENFLKKFLSIYKITSLRSTAMVSNIKFLNSIKRDKIMKTWRGQQEKFKWKIAQNDGREFQSDKNIIATS